jgi:hypothetical protein
LDKLAEPCFDFQRPLFGCTSLGHVTRGFDEAEQISALIVDGINDGKRPEFRAILA